MESEEPIHKLVIDVIRGSSRHELLDHEADLIGVDHRLRGNWPASDGPKPLGKDHGLSATLAAPGPGVPLHDDQPTVFATELVSPRLAATQPPRELERRSRSVGQQRCSGLRTELRCIRHVCSVAPLNNRERTRSPGPTVPVAPPSQSTRRAGQQPTMRSLSRWEHRQDRTRCGAGRSGDRFERRRPPAGLRLGIMGLNVDPADTRSVRSRPVGAAERGHQRRGIRSGRERSHGSLALGVWASRSVPTRAPRR